MNMRDKQKKSGSTSTQLQDIRLDITWSNIARKYFNKSASWLYNKMNGIDGNGGEGDFTYAEKLKLRNAESRLFLTPKRWVEMTNTVGVFSKSGCYGGGVFAHKDIARSFGVVIRMFRVSGFAILY
jgi:hypothetical protein